MKQQTQSALANSQPSSRRSLVPWAVGGGLLGVSSIASADVAAAITSAFAGAQTNVTAVVTGIIALAAIVTGVGLIWKFLTR